MFREMIFTKSFCKMETISDFIFLKFNNVFGNNIQEQFFENKSNKNIFGSIFKSNKSNTYVYDSKFSKI